MHTDSKLVVVPRSGNNESLNGMQTSIQDTSNAKGRFSAENDE